MLIPQPCTNALWIPKQAPRALTARDRANDQVGTGETEATTKGRAEREGEGESALGEEGGFAYNLSPQSRHEHTCRGLRW